MSRSRLGPYGAPFSGGTGDSGPPPAPSPRPRVTTVTTRFVEWQTLVDAVGPVTEQVPSYEFSNGRKFYQPEDREL